MEQDIVQEMTARGERYCAGAEHCEQEVREKVRQWCGAYSDKVERCGAYSEKVESQKSKVERCGAHSDRNRGRAARVPGGAVDELMDGAMEADVEAVVDVEDVADEVVARLVETGYIDERRYARAFAHDKLAYQGWGRVKIEAMLRAKGVAQAAIREALESIDEDTYDAVLERLISKRRGEAEERVIRFCLQRGFRYEEIRARLRR